jgi:predicted RNase H-like nuclease (RuvC/YqgF family)
MFVFQTLYKSQVKELKEEIEEKIKKIEELKQELSNLREDRYTQFVC